MKTTVNENSGIYYTGQYWNDLPQVLEYMCENLTGNNKKWWVTDFKERYAPSPFKTALFLNCGNGWVERDFIDKNIVEWAAAFDYSSDLIAVAEREKGMRPIRYFRADANSVDFAENQFDLVVNVAALHHVQYLNRLCNNLCRAIKDDGLFVNFDYIGPARNQYSYRHWRRIKLVNGSLPKGIAKWPLVKPHLPTMLITDPTEAIHSDLIISTITRYFDIAERHDTGGGIAYEILTHNSNLNKVPLDILSPQLDKVLQLDKKYTAEKKVPPLFSYFVATARKRALHDRDMLQRFQRQEDLRELRADKKGGVYSIRDYIKLLTHKITYGAMRSKLFRWLGSA